MRNSERVERVVILGRGGAGKSVAARELGELLHLPVIELDKMFWSADLSPTAPERWAALQAELASAEHWIMDGDLGPYDVLAPRLARADTVVVLDYGLVRCVWRAARRSRERWDFWFWVLTWRVRWKSTLLAAAAAHSPRSALVVLRRPRHLRRLLKSLA